MMTNSPATSQLVMKRFGVARFTVLLIGFVMFPVLVRAQQVVALTDYTCAIGETGHFHWMSQNLTPHVEFSGAEN